MRRALAAALIATTCGNILIGTAAAERGQPWPRHAIDDTARGADGVRLADVNGDGLPDVATAWEEAGLIRAYLHPGHTRAKQPWPAVTVGQVASPEDAVFADLDGDGAVDVVSSCEGRERTVYVHWAPKAPDRSLDPAAWRTEPIPATRNVAMWMFAAPMQLDGRGGLDLVVGGKGEGAVVAWLQSPDEPRDLAAWKLHPLRPCGWIMSIQAHDMGGDGDFDILVSDRKGPARGVFWLENPGPEAVRRGAPWPERRIGAEDREVMFLTRGDLDGDGRAEIVAATRDSGIAVLRQGDDPRARWSRDDTPMPSNCGGGKGVAIGDLDGDGRSDLVVSCEGASAGRSGVVWLRREDSADGKVWTAREISGPEGEKFDRIELVDLDGDGDLDVLTTCEAKASLGVIWYENPLRNPLSR